MSDQKFLIDTNVFIGLEDDKEISPQISSLTSLAHKYGVGLFVHEVSKEDIQRDKNQIRKRISLSKITKFPILGKVRALSEHQLSLTFGPLLKPNDVIDATLLHALKIEAVNFLITEDKGLHDRARRFCPELSRRILFIADAVFLLKSTYEPVDVPVRYVEEVEAHQIPLEDEIFDSLREGYPDFDQWWTTKCVAAHRKCWIVIDDGLAGIIVRKDETKFDTDAKFPANKILKICTFKVRPEKRGTKLGELLLKQAFWFAQVNKYDLIYLTTFKDQQALIDLLEYYGFSQTHTSSNGELTYEKKFSFDQLTPAENTSAFDNARVNYPRFETDEHIKAYGVPIIERYHDQLFPDLKDNAQLELFTDRGFGDAPKRPGNTIRKVYLCRAQANIEEPGSLLFFYKSRSKSPPSQAITTVGIFEDMAMAKSTNELRMLAGGRSVYSDSDITEWVATSAKPVKVINFLLGGYVEPPIYLDELVRLGVFKKHPPQSIFKLEEQKKQALLKRATLGFDI